MGKYIRGAKNGRTTSSKTDNDEPLPDKLTIQDDDIDNDLRSALYKAFQRKARKQGISLAKIKKRVEFEYSLDCNLKEK